MSVDKYLDDLQFLTTCKYGKNNMGKKFGAELAADIEPFLTGDFSSINDIEGKYRYLSDYHVRAQKYFRDMPLELKRIKEETSSYMCDKMSYFRQIHYNLKHIKNILMRPVA